MIQSPLQTQRAFSFYGVSMPNNVLAEFHAVGLCPLWIAIGLLFAITFGWLVLAKVVTRACRRLGVKTPCPFWLGWILLIRPGAWPRFRDRTLKRIGLRTGEKALEIGCGVGVYTPVAASAVAPAGVLHAIDVQPRMVEATRDRLREDAVMNAHVQVADAAALPFEDASIDRVFLISAFPEVLDKPAALREIHRVLRPDGVLSISEEFFDPEMFFPSETRRIVEAHGFIITQQFGSAWTMYTINFQCADVLNEEGER